MQSGSTSPEIGIFNGIHNVSTAYTGFTILFTDVTTATGTLRIYGLKNS
jgi:hypothetical protein